MHNNSSPSSSSGRFPLKQTGQGRPAERISCMNTGLETRTCKNEWFAQGHRGSLWGGKNVTQAYWVSGPSSVPNRESWPETAQKLGNFSYWTHIDIVKFWFASVTVPVSLKLPQVFWKLDCYPFSKTHPSLGKGWQRSWGLITSGHCTTGKVHLTIVWNWFTAPL